MFEDKLNINHLKKLEWVETDFGPQIKCIALTEDTEFELHLSCATNNQELSSLFINCLDGVYGEINGASPPDLKSLKNIAFFTKVLSDVNVENQRGSERGQVLVCSSIVDEYLCRLLESYICADHPKEADKLLRDLSGAAATFSARNRLCLLLGLIDKSEFDAVNLVIKIRNKFAHHISVSFENDSKLKDQAKELYKQVLNDSYFDLGRHWYSSACTSLALIFNNRLSSITNLKCIVNSEVPMNQRNFKN